MNAITTTGTMTKPKSVPTKFTPQTRRRLLRCIALGTPLSHAAPACGVAYNSFCAYRAAHSKFEAAIQRAIAKAIESRLALIKRAADKGDLRAATWYLEKCHSRYFGSRIELTGADGGPIAGAIITLQWPHQQNHEITDAENRPALPAPEPG